MIRGLLVFQEHEVRKKLSHADGHGGRRTTTTEPAAPDERAPRRSKRKAFNEPWVDGSACPVTRSSKRPRAATRSSTRPCPPDFGDGDLALPKTPAMTLPLGDLAFPSSTMPVVISPPGCSPRYRLKGKSPPMRRRRSLAMRMKAKPRCSR